MTPKVSVVMPVRNGGRFLGEAVDSILGQTLTALELIVIDDGSDDGTASVLAGIGDARVRVLRQERLGLVTALNRGLVAARAPYVARMDADDVAMPDRLVRQVAVLEAEPAIAAVGSACRVIGSDGGPRRTMRPPLTSDGIHAALSERNCMIHPSVTMRRAAVLDCGSYRMAFARAEDFDLWLRLRERHRLVNLPDALLDYREHPGQSEWAALEQRILSEMGALAAAARRAAGQPDGVDGSRPVDNALLRRLGMDEHAIASGIVARAMGAAIDALHAGRGAAAREAVSLALRQPGLRARTRAHLWLLRARAFG
jgi:glycosyltransferase involved in cell wall biosynthesis